MTGKEYTLRGRSYASLSNPRQLSHLVEAPEAKENERSDKGHAHALQIGFE